MEVRLVRKELQKCWRTEGCVSEGWPPRTGTGGRGHRPAPEVQLNFSDANAAFIRVNHYETCSDLSQRYLELLRENKVCIEAGSSFLLPVLQVCQG